VGREASPGRARCIRLVVVLGVLLLGLTPYPRAFTRTLRQAEALQLNLSAAKAATAHALLGRFLMDEAPAEAAALTQGVHKDR
jgi:type II secretory pathway pseudopilin PulG